MRSSDSGSENVSQPWKNTPMPHPKIGNTGQKKPAFNVFRLLPRG